MFNRVFFLVNIFLSIGGETNTRHVKFIKDFNLNIFENSS
jgi:hypothetical protein